MHALGWAVVVSLATGDTGMTGDRVGAETIEGVGRIVGCSDRRTGVGVRGRCLGDCDGDGDPAPIR